MFVIADDLIVGEMFVCFWKRIEIGESLSKLLAINAPFLSARRPKRREPIVDRTLNGGR